MVVGQIDFCPAIAYNRNTFERGKKMGNRSYIQVDSKSFSAPIVFYGHWAGTENLEAVKNVLARTDRIGDEVYLSAQIFNEFANVLGAYTGGLGFGITTGDSSAWYGDEPTVFVNADNGEYTYLDEVYREFAKSKSMT